MSNTKSDSLCINALRFLAVDAVQKANSGHPGAPMGMAAMAYALWQNFLKHNPQDPAWPNRDRFILSAGHASALLYSLLHLTGYDLPLDELKNFRQWGSKTPGHPEYGLTPGVEMTTGPLGQGFASGVGMAMAEAHLAAVFNQPDCKIIDHYTYGIVSDGDLMEGVASEAASLAGHLALGKLIYLYDDNEISIEGSTELAFTENTALRFESYGWQVIGPVDGLNPEAVSAAIKEAQSDSARPSLIICKTVIGFGSPNKAGKASAHGEPLGTDEVAKSRKSLGWDYEPFVIPPEALAEFRMALDKGKTAQQVWQSKLDYYASRYPEKAALLQDRLSGKLPDNWDNELDKLFDKAMASREASGLIINTLASRLPALMGGSADLSPSNKTVIKDGGEYEPPHYEGRNIHFGVREHAMGAIANGLALHGGIIPYVATFLIFYDYMRPAVRLASLMGQRVIYIFTHDSIGLGEDGPTHQPIEQLAGLRSVPGLVTIRPADSYETAQAWKTAILRKDGPTAIALSRQKLPLLDNSQANSVNLAKGAYILAETDSRPQVALVASGSEVSIAVQAAEILKNKGVSSRVVSFPSWQLFEAQLGTYRQSILPASLPRVIIEAGSAQGWCKYLGANGDIISIDHFGASAPAPVLYQHFGLTPENMAEKALKLLENEDE
ncbi:MULTISPECIES: transketolase [Dehalococcoides]|jgi:transketolase, bacterial and yeast|uniref:Transketolase n=3 Tax=root TaxID=1 RepID=A0AB38ZAS5_9CHLR|nr:MULTISPECIES: transketolase [Dehalococcoides]AQU03026.1 transketolase [Dehalococcoides mccartyi]AQU04343.1 transketolase [Dehalococcoides mccartyi]MEA4879370.1 transketolase [Dehalococcoides mccartyi]OBW62081.1 MAG: transketolase [Dehalococcoides mccartyi]POZ58820.1 Transketolase [Dehalococcoides mccartyi]